MLTTQCQKFKGEIENYLKKDQLSLDIKIDRAFCSLKLKTWLCRCNIIKKDGYPASHLLFILFVLPLLRIKTVNSFCNKQWHQWSLAGKNTFYRFKHKAHRWRTLLYQLFLEISRQTGIECNARQECYFIVDDTAIPKRGKYIENVSYIYDHSLGRSVLGFCLVSLGLFTGSSYYPLDFSYWFSQRRHTCSPENIGNRRSISGRMSCEAAGSTKLDLAVAMLKRAVAKGIKAGYVLFDSWYAWPVMINQIRQIDAKLHVICRLKNTKTLYEYRNRKYRLGELYQRVKKDLVKSKRTGLLLKRVKVKMPGADDPVVIVFAKGYQEPEETEEKGKRRPKKPKWVAFLSTDRKLQAPTIIKKYTRRWTCEVFFKESKQLLHLGKDPSNSFRAQVFATTISYLRYAVLAYLNEKENHVGFGPLFEDIVDESATITYAGRIWEFFRGLFEVSLSKIFTIFEIEDDFQSFFNIFDSAVADSIPHLGWET
jgi:hypothetical protein